VLPNDRDGNVALHLAADAAPGYAGAGTGFVVVPALCALFYAGLEVSA